MENVPPPNNNPNAPEKEPILDLALAALVRFAPQWIGVQIQDNNNGWLEEDPEEEEIEGEDMVNNEEDDAEVINPYEEADPHNRPPPTSDEKTEFTPPVVQIADVDDVPIPPVIHFGSNFHVGESLATRDLLAGNSKVYAPGPMFRTEKKMAKKLRQDELRMNGQEFDITALDSAVRENRFKNSKMMKLITGLSRKFTEIKNQNRRAEELSHKEVPISEGSPVTRTESYMETYKTVSQDIRDQLNAEVEAGESINVQDLETNLYWEFGKFTSHDGESLESYYSRFYKMMNELIKNQCDVTNHQVNVQFLLHLQPEWQRNRGKAIVNSPQPIYDQEPSMVAEDEETSKDKEIDKLMDLISLSFKKIYNLPTTTFELHQTPVEQIRIILQGLTEALGMKIKGLEFRHVARECQKPKRVKDAAYHREKTLLCKQEEAGIQLNAEQADWRDDTDDESEDKELEAHYMYMAQLQEVSSDVAYSGPIFDAEQVQSHETFPIEQDEHNVIIDSLDMNYDREHIDQNDDDNDLA
nr:hypothetical protein [Tanacetum cinerariifolium]